MQYNSELIKLPDWMEQALHNPLMELRLAMSFELTFSVAELIALKYWRFN